MMKDSTTKPQPIWPPVPHLNWRNAKQYVGKTIAEFCKIHGFKVDTPDDPITARRLARTIEAIRVKKAYSSRIHILTGTIGKAKEWVLVIEYGNQEVLIAGLATTREEGIQMFGEATYG